MIAFRAVRSLYFRCFVKIKSKLGILVEFKSGLSVPLCTSFYLNILFKMDKALLLYYALSLFQFNYLAYAVLK